MNEDAWTQLHEDYKTRDWIDKPSIFAETAVKYFPAAGTVLDLGAGLGQDSRYFAELGYKVVSTDLRAETLQQKLADLPESIRQLVTVQGVDLREPLRFADASFDVVYAHLSLHYFEAATTERIFDEIHRVLKPGGVFAFFTNSTTDPEYNTGEKLEDNYYLIQDTAKRYFDVESAKHFARKFTVKLADDQGETYKDTAKGVHNLIRYIGTKD